MAEVTKEQIEEAIKGYIEPNMEKDLVSTKCVKSIDIDVHRVRGTVSFGEFQAGGEVVAEEFGTGRELFRAPVAADGTFSGTFTSTTRAFETRLTSWVTFMPSS